MILLIDYMYMYRYLHTYIFGMGLDGNDVSGSAAKESPVVIYLGYHIAHWCTLHLHSGCKKTYENIESGQGSRGMISIAAAADGGDGWRWEMRRENIVHTGQDLQVWKRRKKWSKFKNTRFFNHGFQPNSHPKFAASSLRHWDTCGNTAASSDFTTGGAVQVFSDHLMNLILFAGGTCRNEWTF